MWSMDLVYRIVFKGYGIKRGGILFGLFGIGAIRAFEEDYLSYIIVLVWGFFLGCFSWFFYFPVGKFSVLFFSLAFGLGLVESWDS